MKTIEEIKNEVAVKHGYGSFRTLLYRFYNEYDTLSLDVQKVVNEAMQEYAKQCCDMQIEECAKNAKIRFGNSEETTPNSLYFFNISNNKYVEPDIDSIVMTTNVAETNNK